MQVRSQLAILALAAANFGCAGLEGTAQQTMPLRNFNTLSQGEQQQFSACVVRTTPNVSPQRLQQGIQETISRNPKVAKLFDHPETRQTMITGVAVSLAQADCASAQRIIPKSVPPINIKFKINGGSSPSAVTF